MRLTLDRGMSDSDISSEEQLRRNIEELLAFYGWNQTQFAERLGVDQAWVSRHLSRKPPPHGARFQFWDLDKIATLFGLSPAELLQPKFGRWDRRHTGERRSGQDRRRQSRPDSPRPGRPRSGEPWAPQRDDPPSEKGVEKSA